MATLTTGISRRLRFLQAIFVVSALGFQSQAQGQATPGAGAPASSSAGSSDGAQDAEEPKAANAVGLFVGPFLPNRIAGISEMINGVGARYAKRVSKGVFEGWGWTGRGDGAEYSTVAIDYRFDTSNELIQVLGIIGFHLDTYKPSPDAPTTTDMNIRVAGGWHIGGGIALPITPALKLRSDFILRLGPGLSFFTLVGTQYEF